MKKMKTVHADGRPIYLYISSRVVATTLFQMGWVIPGSPCVISQASYEMDFFHFFEC